MKRMRILGLALVALFAISAVAAAGASASLPTFAKCGKVEAKNGKYTDKNCSILSAGENTGKYELEENVTGIKKKTFKGKGGAATLTTPKLENVVTCAKFKDAGEITGAKTEGKVVSTFGKCESLGKSCHSTLPLGGKGTIITENLSGEIGYINASKKEVGVDLGAEAGGSEPLAKFDCGEGEGVLHISTVGHVIGQLSPVNTFSKSNVTTFEVEGAKFEQKIKKFEGGPVQVLSTAINGNGPFESGQQATATNKGENLEIKA